MKTFLLISIVFLIPVIFVILLFTTTFFKDFNKINHD